MIVSVSRRTDIPAFYSEWFMNRLLAGFALVQNPMNPKQIIRVDLSPVAVDGFVFWTRNPSPFFPVLERIEADGLPYYFNFTLTPYGRKLEPGLPDNDELIRNFRRLSDRIGSDRVNWRYDPIIISEFHDSGWHLKQFESLCQKLSGATEKCIISFYKNYRFADRKMKPYGLKPVSAIEKLESAEKMAAAAAKYGIKVEACAETVDLSSVKVGRSRCVDAGLLGKIAGRKVSSRRDSGQRKECCCDRSVDIGAYSTCRHGCLYCYAARRNVTNAEVIACHQPDSPFPVNWPGSCSGF